MHRTQTHRHTSKFLIAALILLGSVAAFTGIAAAHDFSGSGDCDGWTLKLDGTYGAHTIVIDGVGYSPKTTYFFADTSPVEHRTFKVKWDKDSNDVTKTHTLYRDTYDCKPTTTTVSPTTAPPTSTPPTTEAPSTTTTTKPGDDPVTTTKPDTPDTPETPKTPPAIVTVAEPSFTG